MPFIHRVEKIIPRTIFILALFLLPITSSAQSETDLPNELGTALGIFKLNTDATEVTRFPTFDFFELKKFPAQEVPLETVHTVVVDGRVKLKDGTEYRFLKATLKRRRDTREYEFIQFRTVDVDGVGYTFKGKFLEDKVQERPGRDYTSIRGTLSRYENGRKVLTAFLSFFQYAEL